ncbi:MAG: YncE family protein [Patescibacteria group bacterium]
MTINEIAQRHYLLKKMRNFVILATILASMGLFTYYQFFYHLIYTDPQNKNCRIDIYPSYHYEQADVASTIDTIKVYSPEYFQKICRYTKEIKYNECKGNPHVWGTRVGGCVGTFDQIWLTDVQVSPTILVHETCHLHQNYTFTKEFSKGDRAKIEAECYSEQNKFLDIMTKDMSASSTSGTVIPVKSSTPFDSRIDYITGDVPVGVAFDNITNSVWVSNWRSGTVSKINNITGGKVDYPVGVLPYGVTFDSVTKSVWVASWSSEVVSKVDIFTGTKTDYPLKSRPFGVTFDSVTNSVWIAEYYGDIIKMNIFTGLKDSYNTEERFISFLSAAFDPVTNSIWITNQHSNFVIKVNVFTGTRISYPVGDGPSGLAFDGITNSIWVANAGSNTVSKINIHTGARSDYATNLSPDSVAFDQKTNSVWVTNRDSDNISKINVRTGAKMDYFAGDRPRGVVFDPVTNSVWVANSGSNTISKIKVQ